MDNIEYEPLKNDNPCKYDTQWKAWTVIMYVPATGCYSLEASWPEGGWQVNFAAGS